MALFLLYEEDNPELEELPVGGWRIQFRTLEFEYRSWKVPNGECLSDTIGYFNELIEVRENFSGSRWLSGTACFQVVYSRKQEANQQCKIQGDTNGSG